MVELEKLNKQYKAQQGQQREDKDKGRKKEVAEKCKEQRTSRLSEGEQQLCTMNSVNERKNTEEESLKGKENCSVDMNLGRYIFVEKY